MGKKEVGYRFKHILFFLLINIVLVSCSGHAREECGSGFNPPCSYTEFCTTSSESPVFCSNDVCSCRTDVCNPPTTPPTPPTVTTKCNGANIEKTTTGYGACGDRTDYGTVRCFPAKGTHPERTGTLVKCAQTGAYPDCKYQEDDGTYTRKFECGPNGKRNNECNPSDCIFDPINDPISVIGSTEDKCNQIKEDGFDCEGPLSKYKSGCWYDQYNDFSVTPIVPIDKIWWNPKKGACQHRGGYCKAVITENDARCKEKLEPKTISCSSIYSDGCLPGLVNPNMGMSVRIVGLTTISPVCEKVRCVDDPIDCDYIYSGGLRSVNSESECGKNECCAVIEDGKGKCWNEVSHDVCNIASTSPIVPDRNCGFFVKGGISGASCVVDFDCNSPPKDTCADEHTILSHEYIGKCSGITSDKCCGCSYDPVTIPCGEDTIVCWDGSVITKQKECYETDEGAYCFGASDCTACPSCPTPEADEFCQNYGYSSSTWDWPYAVMGCGYGAGCDWQCCGCVGNPGGGCRSDLDCHGDESKTYCEGNYFTTELTDWYCDIGGICRSKSTKSSSYCGEPYSYIDGSPYCSGRNVAVDRTETWNYCIGDSGCFKTTATSTKIIQSCPADTSSDTYSCEGRSLYKTTTTNTHGCEGGACKDGVKTEKTLAATCNDDEKVIGTKCIGTSLYETIEKTTRTCNAGIKGCTESKSTSDRFVKDCGATYYDPWGPWQCDGNNLVRYRNKHVKGCDTGKGGCFEDIVQEKETSLCPPDETPLESYSCEGKSLYKTTTTTKHGCVSGACKDRTETTKTLVTTCNDDPDKKVGITCKGNVLYDIVEKVTRTCSAAAKGCTETKTISEVLNKDCGTNGLWSAWQCEGDNLVRTRTKRGCDTAKGGCFAEPEKETSSCPITCLNGKCVDCKPGDKKPCYTVSADQRNKGVCKDGTQLCSPLGVWGGCTGEVLPSAEICDGKDNDCDGQTDEGCLCTPGTIQQCGTTDVGECDFGTITCSPSGVWGACVGDKGPTIESCNGLDDDCDGQTDEDLTRQCGTTDVGECAFGTETCKLGIWVDCTAIFPLIEGKDNCGNGKDEDCDGRDLPCSELCNKITLGYISPPTPGPDIFVDYFPGIKVKETKCIDTSQFTYYWWKEQPSDETDVDPPYEKDTSYNWALNFDNLDISYTFEEISSISGKKFIKDEAKGHGADYDGLIGGSGIIECNNANGLILKGCYFDGKNWLKIVDSGSSSTAYSFNSDTGTIMLWVKPSFVWKDNQNHAIVHFSKSREGSELPKESSISIEKTFSNKLAFNYKSFDMPDTIELDLDLPNDDWSHIALTWNRPSIKAYVNGVLKAEGAITVPSVGSSPQAFIGWSPEDGSYFKGSIDEFRVYNRALAEDEIKANMYASLKKSKSEAAPTSSEITTDYSMVPYLPAEGKYCYYAYSKDSFGNEAGIETRCFYYTLKKPFVKIYVGGGPGIGQSVFDYTGTLPGIHTTSDFGDYLGKVINSGCKCGSSPFKCEIKTDSDGKEYCYVPVVVDSALSRITLSNLLFQCRYGFS